MGKGDACYLIKAQLRISFYTMPSSTKIPEIKHLFVK
jgi:hypothetical protein